MAIFYGERSEFLQKNKDISKFAVLIYGLIFVAAVLLISFKLFLNIFNPVSIVVIIMMFFPILFVLKKLLSKEKINLFSYKHGLSGEEEVEEYLKRFSDEYLVFKDVKLSSEKWNMDFVVVAPQGIFALEVKSHRGLITCKNAELLRDGKKFEKNILKQVKSASYKLSNYIESKVGNNFFVNPVLVFSSPYAKMNFGLNKIEHVSVINKLYLENLFHSFGFMRWNYYKAKVEETLKSLVSAL